jgi:hypothetical protein
MESTVAIIETIVGGALALPVIGGGVLALHQYRQHRNVRQIATSILRAYAAELGEIAAAQGGFVEATEERDISAWAVLFDHPHTAALLASFARVITFRLRLLFANTTLDSYSGDIAQSWQLQRLSIALPMVSSSDSSLQRIGISQ